MKVLLIGATGPTGRAVLAAAGQNGRALVALARHPDDLQGLAGDHRVLRGDVLEIETLVSAMDDATAVISVLGSRPGRSTPGLLATGTGNILTAMQRAGVRRLVCVTGMGAGSSRGHGPWWYERLLLPIVLRDVYRDKDAQEALIQASDTDWTIVRPAVLTTEPPAGRPLRTAGELAPGQRLRAVSRPQVAAFLLDQVQTETSAWSRQIVHLFT